MKRLLSLLLLIMVSGSVMAAVVGHEVDYQAGDTKLKGYIAWDDAIKGKRPGVLVVHEWWGHNEYARKRARMLAALGYTAFALDMYGDGRQASHPKEASQFSSEVMKNMPEAEARFKAAMQVLQQDKTVDPTRIAAIGYCFGGGVVLQMMRLGVNLKGVASFHGSLGTNLTVKPGTIKSKVLVLNGEADPLTKPEQIAAFKKEMETAKIDYRFINYPGAKHAFTNPDATRLGKEFNLPLEYNEAADKASWQALEEFLKEIFKQ